MCIQHQLYVSSIERREAGQLQRMTFGGVEWIWAQAYNSLVNY